jgi:hypothetical protein
MDLFTSPSENEEISLRELAMPSMEDIEMENSDLTLATTHYEVNPRITKLVATKPFRGVEDDNSYRLSTDKRHIHLRSASVRTYTLFTTGFPRFLSIHGARGLQAFDLSPFTNYSNPNYD